MAENTGYMRYVGKEISPEQFVAEHTFIFIEKGIMNLFDGIEHKSLKAGGYCMARKNRLGRFNKMTVNDELEKMFVYFDERFLRKFQENHQPKIVRSATTSTFVDIKENKLIPHFFQSLKPYYKHGKIKEPFGDVKREELLLILLQKQPVLSDVLFDFGILQKINLEEFMNRNFKFNVSVQRFAFLTGRSLSAFKRDFKTIFSDTPTHWLVKKRLEEAHFLLEKKKQRPSDIYLDLGFETLSHFSFAFKKKFGKTPTEIGG